MALIKTDRSRHRSKSILASFCLCLVCLQYSLVLNAQSSEIESAFVRFVPASTAWEGELQTAISSYRNAAGIEVDLVAAIHIAEPEYYQGLNQYFSTRDVVLYELVAEADEVPDSQDSSSRGSTSGSLLGFIQQTLANFLNVSFQLNLIDYTAENFQHADLTPSQLQALMESKNESFFSMFLSLALAQTNASQAEAQATAVDPASLSSFNLMTIVTALNSDNQNNAFKYLFAEELGRSGGVIVGPELEQQLTLIGDRNNVVFDVLDDTLRNPRIEKISIFYGAAHMPGIERELLGNLGFDRTEQQWRAAWIIP